MLEITERRKAPTVDPQRVAIEALGFIANDTELMNRFLDLSGIEADAIREAAAQPGFLAGVLDFVLAHEPTLIALSHATLIEPAQVEAARQRLEGAPVS